MNVPFLKALDVTAQTSSDASICKAPDLVGDSVEVADHGRVDDRYWDEAPKPLSIDATEAMIR